jgi:hypothetical protein
MTSIKYFVLTVAAACLFTACPAPDANTSANQENTNANANTAESTAEAPTKDALVTLEKSAYDAWKNKDAKFWEDFLADKFVGYGQTGKLDKASAMKEYAGAECDVKSFEFSGESMTPLGNDAAFITYKVSVDGTCAGQKLPASSWAVGAYVRENGKWKGAFHAETPVPDPKAAAPAAAPAKAAESKEEAAKPDAATEALFSIEKKAWEDWKAGNAKGLDEWAGKNLVTLSAAEGWTDRAASLKRWAEDKCEIKSMSITDPASVSFGADYALLTFTSSLDGTCNGQPLGKEWGATIFAKEDGAWKAVMEMGTPAK